MKPGSNPKKKQTHTGRTTMKACKNKQRGAQGCLYTSLASINGGPQVAVCSWCGKGMPREVRK